MAHPLQLELHYRSLLKALTPGVDHQIIKYACWPVYFVDTKTREKSSEITGRAQSALCLYCNKQLAAWGARPASKRFGNRRGEAQLPPVVFDAIDDHSAGCADDWIWSTLARFSTNRMTPDEEQATATWMAGICNTADRGWTSEQAVARMFDRLPSPMGSPEADAVEIMVASYHANLCARSEEEGWEPFVHGQDDAHPHVYMKMSDARKRTLGIVDFDNASRFQKDGDLWVTRGSEERWVPGMCPCGDIGPIGSRWSQGGRGRWSKMIRWRSR